MIVGLVIGLIIVVGICTFLTLMSNPTVGDK
jgi:hypothetical protein